MNKTGKGGAKRGEVRNPNGRPSLLPEVRALAEESRNVVKATLAIYLKMPVVELDKHLRKKGLTSLEHILIKCIERVGNDGDVRAARELMEIVTGKLVDEHADLVLTEDEKYIITQWREVGGDPAKLRLLDGTS